jgi:hypothetical protein
MNSDCPVAIYLPCYEIELPDKPGAGAMILNLGNHLRHSCGSHASNGLEIPLWPAFRMRVIKLVQRMACRLPWEALLHTSLPTHPATAMPRHNEGANSHCV